MLWKLRPIKTEEDLNRRVALTLEMIRGLHQNLGIPAEVLIQPYDLIEQVA